MSLAVNLENATTVMQLEVTPGVDAGTTSLLIEMGGDLLVPNLAALAGLGGVSGGVPVFTGAGAMSQARLQTSPTDAIAGRILMSGAFGLGAGIRLDSVDCNAVVAPGLYYANDPSTNKPTAQGGTLIVAADSGSTLTQIFTERNSGETYIRNRNASAVWQVWRKQYDSRNLVGTVGQSGGLPTDAAFERKSTPNGYYYRFANGLQICTHALAGLTADQAAGSVFRSPADTTWTFPAGFAAPPWVGGHSGDGSSWAVPSGAGELFNKLRRYSYISDAVARTLYVTAIGPWF